MALPDTYRDWFVRRLHDALSGHTSSSVAEAVKYSERSFCKCIGKFCSNSYSYYVKLIYFKLFHRFLKSIILNNFLN